MSEPSQRSPARFRLLPRSRAGWLAIWLSAAFAVCYGAALTVIAARGVNDANPWLSIFGLTGFVLAGAAGVAAFIAIVRRGERGLLVVLPALLGIIAAIFIAGEVIVPH